MTRRQRITLVVAQCVSYVPPGCLITIAVFRLLPFKHHGRPIMLGLGIGLAAVTAVFHRWQWRDLRRREEALRRIFGRMEYP